MADSRFEHTARLLPDGRVLVAGGFNTDGGSGYPAQTELYDPASGTWLGTGNLASPRQEHIATLLADGRVLVAGGHNGSSVFASAEIYDPASGTWSTTGSMTKPRTSHQGTLLPSGQVLVEGGSNDNGQLSSAEFYDPASATWRKTGSLIEERSGHAAILLTTGEVLVADVYNVRKGIYLASAELYDPASRVRSQAKNLGAGRSLFPLTMLQDGEVLAAAGYLGNPIAGAELYQSEAGAGITLIDAGSRKKHGDAGTFDIDLPPTGAPGVECREGNAGLLVETIVFTFSEPVTNVTGTTTTSCGTVTRKKDSLLRWNLETQPLVTAPTLRSPCTV